MKQTITFTDIIEQLDENILNVQFDLQQDWNEEKELMFIQLQQLIIAKANLELILQTGGQIFSSSISK
jgi:ATP-dependent protease HslVU (ClpYQ) peptidase subunit